jgi:acyl carrier protein phosphodiesterase
MIGNLIGDAIKGNKYENLQPSIRKGVLMHRAIDDFTDRHPVNFKIRKLFHPYFGKYAGVYLDMFYDHFLAVGWNEFSKDVSLNTFCRNFYVTALSKHKYLPSKIKNILYWLIIGNRLKNYSNLNSLQTTLEYMHRRRKLPRSGKEAINFLKENYDVIRESFYEFFPLLVIYTRIWRENGSNTPSSQLPDLFLADYL